MRMAGVAGVDERRDLGQCVAAEQLPDTIARVPASGGRPAALGAGSQLPKFGGSPMATPEPAVSSGRPVQARAQLHQVVVARPHRRSRCRRPRRAARRCASRIAAAPAATTPWSISPTLASCICACSTRTRLASVIGVSGWFRMPLSDSSTSPTKRWPLKTVRPFSGKAGHGDREVGQSIASISASVTGPMLPRGVESKVEQYLK